MLAQRMEALLSQWSDALLALMPPPSDWPGLDGGFYCPACGRVHGRSAETIHPLMHRFRVTGDRRFYDAAIRLERWSRFFDCPDGGMVNDTDLDWRGTTVFAAIAWAEALLQHGDLLEEDIRRDWTEHLRCMTDFLMGGFCRTNGPVNYPASCAQALLLAGQVLQEQSLIDEAASYAQYAMERIADDGLLYGEGEPRDHVTPRGLRFVDIGYNVEESLPNLLRYAQLTGDTQMLERVRASFRAHLPLMLPDGGWDNSFGSRMIKWTYWGSRTTDGCLPALMLLGQTDPVFLEAASRHLSLLERCTHGGLLYGGPHVKDAGEPPCVHHTFTHSKALAQALDWGLEGMAPGLRLPRESLHYLHLPSADAHLMHIGPWHGTLIGQDCRNYETANPPTGGLGMLWHEAWGPMLAASPLDYALVEPGNMQRHHHRTGALTPRILWQQRQQNHQSLGDPEAHITILPAERELLTAHVRGRLTVDGVPGAYGYAMTWRLTPRDVTLAVRLSADLPHAGHLILPVICPIGTEVTLTPTGAVLGCRGERVSLDAGAELTHTGAVFHHVPGLRAEEFILALGPGEEGHITLTVE